MHLADLFSGLHPVSLHFHPHLEPLVQDDARQVFHIGLGITFIKAMIKASILTNLFTRFSDMGLVHQGQASLTLFNKVFWVALWSFFAWFMAIWPLANIIQGQSFVITGIILVLVLIILVLR